MYRTDAQSGRKDRNIFQLPAKNINSSSLAKALITSGCRWHFVEKYILGLNLMRPATILLTLTKN